MAVFNGSFVIGDIEVMYWIDPNRHRCTIWERGTSKKLKTMVDKDLDTLKERVNKFVKSQHQRKPGAQPGNQNAAKAETAKRTNIRLYDRHRALAVALAAKLGTSRDEAIRQAIEELAQRLGVTAA